jgi:MFS family permease
MAEAAQAISRPDNSPMKRALGARDFLLLWIGQATSMLGDQFQNIAGAWLVLKLTGDPLALGVVLAVGGIPRAIFTIIGGAITDRMAPRKLMLGADAVRLGLMTLMAIQVFTGTLQPWMIYLYSLIGGIVSGLFGPASMSMAPRLLPSGDLQAGNSLMQGSTQLIGFVGPALAGALIVAFPSGNIGVGLAITVNALTFAVSVITLWMMNGGSDVAVTSRAGKPTNVARSIQDGFSYVLRDPALRSMFVLIAVANLAFGGPLVVGIPYLANIRFPEGAAAFGLITAGYAGGNLLGIVLSGILPKITQKAMRAFMLVMFFTFTLGIGAMAWVNSTWLAMGILFALGALNGQLAILVITGLQRNTPKEMLGRMMSMLLLGNLAFTPLSQAFAGAILRWSVPGLFLICAGMLGACAVYLAVPRVGKLLSAGLTVEHPAATVPTQESTN